MIKIGHRGAAGYEPENTLRSFKKALKLKVDVVELDVHICKSGELVVIHDDKVDRTTGGKGYVVEKTLKELQKLNAGRKGKIPTLQEALDLVDKKAKVWIELKAKGTAERVFEVIEKYVKEKNWKYSDFLILSFNQYELKKFSELNPNIKTGISIHGIPIMLAKLAEKVSAYSVNLNVDFISLKLVDRAHKIGLKVFVYTANSPEEIKRMKKLGVDGIFSDFPDRI